MTNQRNIEKSAALNCSFVDIFEAKKTNFGQKRGVFEARQNVRFIDQIVFLLTSCSVRVNNFYP
jgi:hypothetical protein